jgi:hypothetical protein
MKLLSIKKYPFYNTSYNPRKKLIEKAIKQKITWILYFKDNAYIVKVFK